LHLCQRTRFSIHDGAPTELMDRYLHAQLEINENMSIFSQIDDPVWGLYIRW
jgi:hypothetical protein